MAKLTSKERNKLPDAAFALPKERKYPIKKLVNGKLVPDKSHAANAKARASQMKDKGIIGKSTESKIKGKANKELKPKRKSTSPAMLKKSDKSPDMSKMKPKKKKSKISYA